MLSHKKIASISKHSLMLLFAILAFSSCGLKEFVAEIINIEYKRSFNKTKSTTSTCIYAKSNTSYISISKQKIKKDAHRLFENIQSINSEEVNYKSSYPYIYSSNSPPKYILFKRLRIALG